MTIPAESIILLSGPTAAGKGAVALELAEVLCAEIVLCDSVKVYRGLGVGANKPSVEARRRCRFHLLDVCEPTERYSAGRYAEEATAAIAGIRRRGRRVLVVGGTLLFARALFDGLCVAPPTEPEVAAELERLDEGVLRARLSAVDPASVERISPGDRQRLIRALSVYEQSGRSLSDWWTTTPRPDHGAPVERFALMRPREQLYRRINERTRQIFEGGILEETRSLLEAGCPADCPALSTIGYRQAVAVLAGEMELEDAVDSTARETRRLAKRQLSWLRGDERFIIIEVETAGPRATARAISRRLSS